MKKSNKSWIRQLSESYVRHALNEQSDRHQKIKDFFATHPLTKDYGIFNSEKINQILDQTGPHETAKSAIEAIFPHVIADNNKLHTHVAGEDTTEDDFSDQRKADIESDAAADIEADLEGHLSGGGGSEDNRTPRFMWLKTFSV